jgi:dihydroflavonol-4-reductase
VSPLAVVTGASGFVGGAVAREFVAAGHEVRAIARSRAAAAAIASAAPTAFVVEGDVLEPGSLEHAFAGADVVVHAAGLVAACRRDPSAMLRVNVLGTRNAVAAASHAGVGRFVLTSTAATIGERPGEVAREDTVHRGWFLSAYERTKAEAEAAAFALGRDLGVDVVSVNPASVHGPGRTDVTSRMLLSAARGRLPFLVRSTISFVDVSDCARGHVLAAERGARGERYLLCGATMTVDEALELIGRVGGRRVRSIAVPLGLVSTVAGIVEDVFRLVARDPPVCREVTAAIAHGRAYDGSKAGRQLGLVYTPAEETIRRTLDWLASTGGRRPFRRDWATIPRSGPRSGRRTAT